MRLILLVLEDLRTHRMNPLTQGFLAIAFHRFYYITNAIEAPLWRYTLGPFISILMRIGQIGIEYLTGITILPSTSVGRRLRIWHHSGIIIFARSIGNDVTIRQNTTIGGTKSGNYAELPVIGNNVDIGCSTTILGGVHIGDDAVIGAHSLVLSDVPAGHTVGGVPAKTLKKEALAIET